MTYTATYSPEDNKLRLYASSRLDKETYERVRAAGFIWAPKQELFVAPMWTPERENLLLELASEIGDEDKSLVQRSEERAERFEDYSDNRTQDAERAHKAVHAIADNIPFGQPILVGHHSEKHARKDAERIENGMRRAVKMWEQAQYWKDRAHGAILAAKYKELPAVRARRIKGLEADKRKFEREEKESLESLARWTKCLEITDTEKQTKYASAIANYFCHLHFKFTLDKYPRTEHTYEGDMSLWTALDYGIINGKQAAELAIPFYGPRKRRARWLTHIENRLQYERAMLAESGGTEADRVKPEVGGACRAWCSWRGGFSTIRKVNKVSVTLLDNWGNGGQDFPRTIPFDKLKDLLSKAQVDEFRTAGRLLMETPRGFHLSGEAPPPSRAEMKEPEPVPEVKTDIDAMRESLRQGVQVVTANQLFPTPPDLAARMVELADIQSGQEVLEPSAGTGVIVDAIRSAMANETAGRCAIVAVEINQKLAHRLAFNDCLGASRVHPKDFLECNGDLGQFDRVLMNPPFERGADIQHIQHALTMLKPGGRLVAICANGPRQQEALKPLVTTWEDLPEDTFKEQGTGVRTALLVIDKPTVPVEKGQGKLW